MKRLLFATAIIWGIVMNIQGQNYDSLWKQANEAEAKDLPRKEYDILVKIATKAADERDYGQMLKAELKGANVMSLIAPDSLAPAMVRMQKRAAAEKDPVARTVMQTVLWSICNSNYQLEMSPSKPVLTPELCQQLAAVEASKLKPMIVDGPDSRFFADDLLSVVGYELNDYKPLHDYYEQTGQRRAALMTALKLLNREAPAGRYDLRKSEHLQRLDSLIEQYKDLEEVGEAAIARYYYMKNHTYATDEEKWQYINLALERWGAWQRMNELRNAQRDLTASQMNAAAVDRVTTPGKPQKLELINLRNISRLVLRVYRVKADGDEKLEPTTADGYKKLKPKLTLLDELTQTRQFVGKKSYEKFNDSLTIEGLPVGIYMIETETTPATSVERRIYYVSDVRVIGESHPGKKTRLVAVSATTGQPLAGATMKATLWNGYRDYQRVVSLTADSKGEAMLALDDKEYLEKLFAYTKTDKASPATADNYRRFSYYPAKEKTEHTCVYTDRAIYRPGQSVHAAVIVYSTLEGYKHHAVKGKAVTLTLRDANWKTVEQKEVVTDEYGTAAADFTLPRGKLTGQMTIKANSSSSTHIRVEEYKRPTFEVEFPPVHEQYEDGDTLVVKASAHSYSGVPVQGAKVRYKVVRRRAWWWYSYSSYWNQGRIGVSSEDEEVGSGETTTAGDGTFQVEMALSLPPTNYPMFYNFVVTADVTDQGGETHQGQLSVPLGNRPTAFSITVANQILKENDEKVEFHLRNAAGLDMDSQVRYKIMTAAQYEKLTEGGKSIDMNSGKWLTATTNTPVALPKLESGRYCLVASPVATKGEQEAAVEAREFTIFSLDDTRPVVETDDWFYQSGSKLPEAGQTPVTVQVGSSAKDVHIVYSIIAGDKVVESGAVDRSNELLNLKFNYKEEYGNGLLLTFAWMKQGHFYCHTATLTRPLPDKHLKLEWQTFRDKLLPGTKEEWSVKIVKPDGTPAEAQLAAVLYDKSLDQLSQHSWSFWPIVSLPMPSTQWYTAAWGMLRMSSYFSKSSLRVPELRFSHFDKSAFPSYWDSSYRTAALRAVQLRGTGAPQALEEAMMLPEPEPTMMMKANEAAVESEVYDDASSPTADMDSTTGEEAQPVQMRENLQETAFFYPQLTTDQEGCVTMKFTLPESLTTWRFMGLAHTTDLFYGMLEGEAVAKKDLMIQPNMPRFIREDDVATIAARIINTSETDLSGMARLQLVDPDTEQTLMTFTEAFSVKAGETTNATFSIDMPKATALAGKSLLIARCSATTKGFSDGEQHYLPVLPSRERVTVTVPFTQLGPGTKTIDIESLFPKGASASSSKKLTIEYTNNPAWLTVQALPAVGHPSDDCAVCQAVSLYANQLGRHIINQNPQAKNVFRQWQQEASAPDSPNGAGTSLQSALEKNQELKDLVLSETPWVADADREDEQKQRLADFFDENTMDLRQLSAIEKLKKLQRSDGSWSWWPDMPGSFYMTVSVSQMMVRLNKMIGVQIETNRMLDKSFKYMGKEIVKIVKELKRNKPGEYYFPSFTALEWLYICSLDGRKLPSDVEEANAFLKKLLKKDRKTQTIYEKALSAIVLNSSEYIESLKEYTVYKEEMGRYYDTPRAGYSWRSYRIPTQVAAIEAIQLLTPDDKQTIDEMRRWLLQQKRTQAWDTPLNSVDAVYAFLNGEDGLLVSQAESVLKLDGKAMELPGATAGLGYVKVAISGDKDMPRTFEAEKTSQVTSWGAVYAQFMQPTGDIADTGSELSVKREIFISPTTGAANAPSPTTDVTCKVGDRVIVRLTIESQRNLDFVQINDKRAACMEPVKQLSGYRWGYYTAPLDNATNYFFDMLPKGKHVIETEYYIDRTGTYDTGTCTVQCAYAPEYRATTHSQRLKVEK